MKTTKRNKQELVYDALKANPNNIMTADEINIYLESTLNTMEESFSEKAIYNAVYRRQSKGYHVEIIKGKGKVLGFRYNSPPKTMTDPAMDYTIEDKDPLDGVLETIQDITKPVDLPSESDIFNNSDTEPIHNAYIKTPIIDIGIIKTPEALIHLIKAHRPMSVTAKQVMNHFNCSQIEAITLLLGIHSNDTVLVHVNISAIAL